MSTETKPATESQAEAAAATTEDEGSRPKRKFGRPRKNPLPDDDPNPKRTSATLSKKRKFGGDDDTTTIATTTMTMMMKAFDPLRPARDAESDN